MSAVTRLSKVIPAELINADPSHILFRRKGTRTIFVLKGLSIIDNDGIEGVEGAWYINEDLLNQTNTISGRNKAWITAGQVAEKGTAMFYQVALRIILQQPKLRLVHILNTRMIDRNYLTFGYFPK